MESQDFRALIGRSAELRAPVSPARQTSARIIADSRWLVTRTELILDVMARARGHGAAVTKVRRAGRKQGHGDCAWARKQRIPRAGGRGDRHVPVAACTARSRAAPPSWLA